MICTGMFIFMVILSMFTGYYAFITQALIPFLLFVMALFGLFFVIYVKYNRE